MSAREATYIPGPWFRFAPAAPYGGSGARNLPQSQPWLRFAQLLPAGARSRSWSWCQPDGLDIDIRRGLITIVEFKLQHTSAAWWQTRQLYEPVVKAVFGAAQWAFSIVEIVKWFDPDTAFPERFSFIPSLADARPGAFHVHIWNPRR